jgi:hypothetical protein
MTSYEAISQSKKIRQFADLEAISSGYDNRESAALKFFNDRLEERNVRRVFQIDPDFLRAAILRH